MARSGKILVDTHELLMEHIKPGVTTGELDRIAEQHIRGRGGVPTFKGYQGFAGSICASPNDMVVHGIPGDYVLAPGDLLSLDCGVTYGGWVSDCARSYVIGDEGIDTSGDTEAAKLIDSGYRSLQAGIEQCVPGGFLGDVSHAIQQVVEGDGYAVIRKLVGHGVGREMHEEPQIPNYGRAGTPPKLETGMVFAIEPMITTGAFDIRDDPDGWSIFTVDGSLSCHVEHTVAVTDDGPRILTQFSSDVAIA